VQQATHCVSPEVRPLQSRSSHGSAVIGREALHDVSGGGHISSDGLPNIVVVIGRQTYQQIDVIGTGTVGRPLPRSPLGRCTQRLHHTSEIVPVGDSGHYPRHRGHQRNDSLWRKPFGGVHQHPGIGGQFGREQSSQCPSR
jgi:hypothetical protein